MTPTSISPENPLVLASASPRRRDLLAQVALPFQAIPSGASEDSVTADPARLAAVLARKKAEWVRERIDPAWVLGADTVVVTQSDILGKPADTADAVDMLRRLNGRDHQVITGFCVLAPHGVLSHLETVATRVRFRTLTDDEIHAYVRTREPFGKAGAYAIQGIGAFLVSEVSGSYTNVVGLPVCALIQALLACGALERFPVPDTPVAPVYGNRRDAQK